MFKPPSEWSEDDILALGSESINLERKNSIMLDLRLDGASEKKVREEMAIQVSAFANSEGGSIVYGVSDDGEIHLGGISRWIKGRQPTKDWIETVVLTLTIPEVQGIRVYEITSNGSETSKIAKNKAVYVLTVPLSPSGHECRHDGKTYLRKGSHSVPASDEELVQVVRRFREPILEPAFSIRDIVLPVHNDGRISGEALVTLNITLRNRGRTMASTVALETSINEPRSYFKAWEETAVSPRSPVGSSHVVWKLLDAVHLGRDYRFWIELVLPLMLAPIDGIWWKRWAEPLDDLLLRWELFADNAPSRTGQLFLCQDLFFTEKAQAAIDGHRKRRLICNYYGSAYTS